MNIWFKRLLFIGVLFAYLGALYHFTKDEPTIQDIQKLIELNERKIDELREQNRRLHDRLEGGNSEHNPGPETTTTTTTTTKPGANPSTTEPSSNQPRNTSPAPTQNSTPRPTPPPEEPQNPDPEPTVIDRIIEPIQRLIP